MDVPRFLWAAVLIPPHLLAEDVHLGLVASFYASVRLNGLLRGQRQGKTAVCQRFVEDPQKGQRAPKPQIGRSLIDHFLEHDRRYAAL